VAGLANVFGFGAMTNHQNDIRNSRSVLIIGMNPAENHPISMQHILTAKEVNRAVIISVDPRFTKTSAFANKYVRIRSGTDVPFIYALINVILANGWEDKRMIQERTYDFEALKAEVAKYDLDTASDITGASKEDIAWVAKAMADNRPGTIIWAMGGTQHNHATALVRTYCHLQLVLGNMGVPGGGTDVFRGHDGIQGVTDVGGGPETLPGYYGIAESAWKHWANVWGVSHDWLVSRFKSKALMEKPGFTVARWYEGVLLDAKELGQDVNVKALICWGHSTNALQQMDRVKRALEKLELLIDMDPFVTNTAVLPDRKDGVYLLPAATNYEAAGSATNTNRDLQWRQKVVDPVWESRTDLAIMADLAQRLGFGKEFVKNQKGAWKGVPAGPLSEKDKYVKALPEETIEDVLREINMGVLSIGYVGQTPERLKRQQEWAHVFDIRTKKAEGGPVHNEQWGLPWPCWTDQHPGSAILYRTDIPVAEGGLGFRALWGPKAPDGRTMLAADGSAPPAGPNAGYPAEPNYATDLTLGAIRKALAEGRAPYGNGRARFNSWNIPDPVPVHREPIHSPRPDLIAKWPTYDDVKEHYRVPQPYKSMQKPDWVKRYPVILTTGRVVEFEGGSAQERSSQWLVELNPDMYVEMHPKLAHDNKLRHGDWCWIYTPEDMDARESQIKVKVKVTKRVGPDTVFLPFHWGGVFEGKSLLQKYPEGTAPYTIGESANTVTTYGYDRVTQMQETKTSLCRIEKA
jgi:formate dehydrogenase major subunit